MLTRISFVVAIMLTFLLLAIPDRAAIGVMAGAAACFAAVLAARKAGRAGYLWLAGLLVLAVILNPILPLALPPMSSILLLSVSLAVVASWMVVLNRTVPSQSIAQVLHPPDPK
jgi:hypothetical protein